MNYTDCNDEDWIPRWKGGKQNRKTPHGVTAPSTCTLPSHRGQPDSPSLSAPALPTRSSRLASIPAPRGTRAGPKGEEARPHPSRLRAAGLGRCRGGRSQPERRWDAQRAESVLLQEGRSACGQPSTALQLHWKPTSSKIARTCMYVNCLLCPTGKRTNKENKLFLYCRTDFQMGHRQQNRDQGPGSRIV